MDPILQWLEFLIILGLAAAGFFWKSYFPKYMKEKGKNQATKEDIGLITNEIETVKAEISKATRTDELKYKLKYQACTNALSIIDANLSHTLIPPDGVTITKQFASAEEVRTCHNNLILSCESTALINKFSEIMFGPQPDTKAVPPTDQLNEFRNMVRDELNFGAHLELDRDRAWFGTMVSEPKND